MRYPDYEPQVNALLDLARAAERAQELFPDDISSTDIIGRIEAAAGEWAWSLVEIIMDHERRQREFRIKWKRWRKKREQIMRIPRPNAVLIGTVPKRVKAKKKARR